MGLSRAWASKHCKSSCSRDEHKRILFNVRRVCEFNNRGKLSLCLRRRQFTFAVSFFWLACVCCAKKSIWSKWRARGAIRVMICQSNVTCRCSTDLVTKKSQSSCLDTARLKRKTARWTSPALCRLEWLCHIWKNEYAIREIEHVVEEDNVVPEQSMIAHLALTNLRSEFPFTYLFGFEPQWMEQTSE